MTSECKEYQKKIPALLLGDLNAMEMQALEAHLAACSRCRSEQESYARTIQQLSLAGEESIPHHFFLRDENHSLNPLQLFSQMQWQWKTAVAGAIALLLLLGIAAFSRLQIRSNPGGWAVSFGQNDTDFSALKKEILEAVDRKNREERADWIRQASGESLRAQADSARQQQLQFAAALTRMDSKLTGRVLRSEAQAQDETRALIANLYRGIAEQRVRDLEAINLRFESTDASNVLAAQQTSEILGTLLQVADLRLQ